MSRYLSKLRLDNKVAVVAGGAGLIGKEISKALSEAGAKTIIVDINEDEGQRLAKELPNKSRVYYENFDITDIKNVEKGLEKLKQKYGYIDVFVNSFYPRTSDWSDEVENLKLESWRTNVDMHLNSCAWISRKICLMMKERGGILLNFGSIYGVLGNDFSIYEGTGMTGPMAYSAIKGGIINLSRYLASYFGKYNIRVNSICPGGVFNRQNETFVNNYSKKTPLRRMARPEEIAGVVLFLASDLASYITGAAIMVDGGWTAI